MKDGLLIQFIAATFVGVVVVVIKVIILAILVFIIIIMLSFLFSYRLTPIIQPNYFSVRLYGCQLQVHHYLNYGRRFRLFP